MANIKGQMKRNLQNEKRRLANSAFRSGLKTAIKNVEESVENNNKEEALLALHVAYKKLDKGLAKGLSNKNQTGRAKSRLSKLVNTVK